MHEYILEHMKNLQLQLIYLIGGTLSWTLSFQSLTALDKFHILGYDCLWYVLLKEWFITILNTNTQLHAESMKSYDPSPEAMFKLALMFYWEKIQMASNNKNGKSRVPYLGVHRGTRIWFCSKGLFIVLVDGGTWQPH